MTVKILIFEDSAAKTTSFSEYLELRLTHELKCDLEVLRRVDETMLETDLLTTQFHIILIDDDLGNGKWGDEIIDSIISLTDATPEIMGVPKIYYSAGTSIADLKRKIARHGNIQCVTFESLVDSVFERLKQKYFGSV